MIDRLISGALTALFVAITCVLFVLCMALYKGGIPIDWGAAFIWFGCVGGFGFVAGFALGIGRAAEMLGLLWGTAESPKPSHVFLLGATLCCLWLLSYAIIH